MLNDQLNSIIDSFHFLAPEAALMGGSMILLIAGLFIKRGWIIQGLFCATILSGLLLSELQSDPLVLFSGTLAIGPMESILQLLLMATTLWIVFFPGANEQPMEFYFLVLALLVGSLFLLISNQLLMVYLALELSSFSSYLLTNFSFKKRSFEAGLKYLLFGGVSSAIMLYGLSLVYGYTGSLTITEWNLPGSDPFLIIGIVAFLAGFFFKTSVFPFHIWTPSTYEEAPTSAVAILSIVPKVAGFVVLHRFILGMGQPWLIDLVLFAGISTLAVGTLGALGQQNNKRLIAYGSIGHSGFLLVCLIIPGTSGATAFIWYACMYALMNLAVFHLLATFEMSQVLNVDDFKGLGKRAAGFGVLLVVVMVSLIGLPPTAGFSAKLYVFSAIWAEFQSSGSLLLLCYFLVALLSVTLSLIYYLKIPFRYFISEGETGRLFKPEIFTVFLATILSASLLWFFFQPNILNKMADHIKFIAW